VEPMDASLHYSLIALANQPPMWVKGPVHE
jgi:hypothetical protein